MKLTKSEWARATIGAGQPVQYTMSQHQPWRGIDEGMYVLCSKKGVTTLDQRPYGLFCGGCGDRIGNVDKGSLYRQKDESDDDGK
jgi:hypothetical protein